jgi:glycosyltransferase involved in cell wall biosynthesis
MPATSVYLRTPLSMSSGYGRDGIALALALTELGFDVSLEPTAIRTPLPSSVAQLLCNTAPPSADIMITHLDPAATALLGLEPHHLHHRLQILWTMWESPWLPRPSPRYTEADIDVIEGHVASNTPDNPLFKQQVLITPSRLIPGSISDEEVRASHPGLASAWVHRLPSTLLQYDAVVCYDPTTREALTTGLAKAIDTIEESWPAGASPSLPSLSDGTPLPPISADPSWRDDADRLRRAALASSSALSDARTAGIRRPSFHTVQGGADLEPFAASSPSPATSATPSAWRATLALRAVDQQPSFTEDAPLRLLMLGEMNDRKNPMAAIEAVSLARTRGLHVTLTLKGSSSSASFIESILGRAPTRSDEDHIANTILSAPGKEWLIFDNRIVPSSSLPDIYRAHHALIAPSRGEGKNLPALEALASGLPVIATQVGGHSTWLSTEIGYPTPATLDEDRRMIHVPVAPIASAIQAIYDNPREAYERGRNAARTIPEACTWERAIHRLLASLRAAGHTV